MSLTFKQGSSPGVLSVKLAAMSARLKNLQPVLEPAGKKFITLMEDSFYKTRTPEGTKWKANAISTLKYKHGVLGIETGKLIGSLYAKTAGLNSLVIGASAPYAKFFNNGTIFIPGRAFMPTGKDGNSKLLMAQLGEWIKTYVTTGKKPT